jgi:nicotinate-nucleotide adenylyltransferase
MRVGIFGGTFDPVHIGHLRASEEIRESFSLDRIYFVPAFVPPHKRDQRVTDARERFIMLKKALRGKKGFVVSDVEIKKEGISYSIETVEHFERLFGDIYFILGEEAFSEIETWLRWQEIFSHANFIVMVRSRNGQEAKKFQLPASVSPLFKEGADGVYEHASGKRLFFGYVTDISVSSTKIRDLVRQGRSIRYLVPACVEAYIVSRGLYRK